MKRPEGYKWFQGSPFPAYGLFTFQVFPRVREVTNDFFFFVLYVSAKGQRRERQMDNTRPSILNILSLSYFLAISYFPLPSFLGGHVVAQRITKGNNMTTNTQEQRTVHRSLSPLASSLSLPPSLPLGPSLRSLALRSFHGGSVRDREREGILHESILSLSFAFRTVHRL